VGRTGPNCEFAECPKVNPSPTPTPVSAAFGPPATFAIGEQVKFSDGLVVSLVEINDSRCSPEVVCVWEGELSALFRITGGNAGKSLKEVRLGTVTVERALEDGYTLTLKEATVTTVTIVVTNGGEEISLREGGRESSFLLEKIYPDRVTGLNFGEYPIATSEGYPLTLRIGEIVSNGCTITLTLTRIEGNTALFTKETDFSRPCPICLALGTLIDTPIGEIPVEEIRVGMVIWSIDKSGNRVSAEVTRVSKTPVPVTHQIIHLILHDGRELFASPGHPIGDGRTVGALSARDFVDGSRVRAVEKVMYQQGYTYDVLPSGETGFYWANGILVDSTLH
jgi:hypothetical protein